LENESRCRRLNKSRNAECPERRSIGRTRINRNVLLFFVGQAGVFSCCVRDVTNLGAGIQLDGLNIMPMDFDLSFDNLCTIRKCRII